MNYSFFIGVRISFLRFIAYGAPITMLTVFIAMVFVWLRYYVLGG